MGLKFLVANNDGNNFIFFFQRKEVGKMITYNFKEFINMILSLYHHFLK